MTDTETNKKIVDEFTQGLFSEGDLEAADEYLSVELVIHDPVRRQRRPGGVRRSAWVTSCGRRSGLGVCRCVLCLYRADCSRSVSA
jgi:hypothetical protein